MTDKKFIVGIVIATLVILAGGVFLAVKMGSGPQVTASPGAKSVTKVTSHDWGDVKMSEGKVTADFDIENQGSEILKLYNVTTSCMCTTAQLSYKGKKSPEFGMHDKSAYVLEVPAKETAKLTVVFDPAFHGPSGVGPITREINIKTNDPDRGELNFMLTGNVDR